MKTVLVIDDDPAIRKLMVTMLERAGYAVLTADDGKQGLALYRSKMPDLVVTDIVMPDREGLEVIQEINRSNPEQKIIAISGAEGVITGAYLKLAETFGANRVFEKPFRTQEVLATIRELLGD